MSSIQVRKETGCLILDFYHQGKRCREQTALASEQWHPNQEGRILKDGSYELKVPYSDDRELLMDIMKYGGDCQVVHPTELRHRALVELRRSLERNGN